MNLSDFEKVLDVRIVQRGLHYFEQGHIQSLEQISETNWQAEVTGTDDYIVDIVIDEEDGTITYADCDCPYELICKHIVATLYEIKRYVQQPMKSEATVKKPALQDLLKEKTKQQLIELILTIGKKHKGFIRELELELAPIENERELAEKVIQQYLTAAEDRSGFIRWGKTSLALKGIDQIQERASIHIAEGNHEVALELIALCLRYSLEALECGDDSSGDLSGSAEYSIELVYGMIQSNNWNFKQKKQAMCAIEEMIFSEGLEQWETWQLDLLAACIPLCDNPPCEQQFLTIAKLLEEKNQSKWCGDYIVRRIQELKQKLSHFQMTDERAAQFLQQHPTETALRERLIQSALEKKDYEKMLKLATQGLQMDEREKNQWKRAAYCAQKALQNKSEMKKLAFDLLVAGDRDYYKPLKQLYSEDEWHEKREYLLDILSKKNSYLYSELIVEEQQIERVLAYCQQYPIEILDYYSLLVGHYDQEVVELFTITILEEAQSATKRTYYKTVAQMIGQMKFAGYTEQATNIQEKLIKQYYRRSAFIDELAKV